ncbi:MAG: hypothetical protein QOE68_1747, partial [Thermoanaerobaculia bacterium]|nr:hypothetical protein [Thermoanaerobaculia bacterium]
MRGSSPRAQSSFTVDVRTFGWERVLAASLRHTTLLFEQFEAAPLASLRDPGKRDRLSLLGQFAAHEALLQFAGVSDADFLPAEWAVVQKRGVDCRLVRLAGRRPGGDPIPILTIVQHFAAAIEAPPVEVLRQSSGRADAVYCEIDARLRSDATADLRWFRASAVGLVAAPGVDALRSIPAAGSARFHCSDRNWLATLLAAYDDVLVIGERSSPLQRYSGITSLQAVVPNLDAMAETEIVERIIDAATRRRLLFAVASMERLDPGSR